MEFEDGEEIMERTAMGIVRWLSYTAVILSLFDEIYGREDFFKGLLEVISIV